ncbi:MAG: ABC transporter ATP-binding protein [Pseudomonadota bacterium]|jgi:lipoprotein-releasing system ATP-binding protein|nr:ABC transporter ATP-binding protein [Alphaproteobacteria bacterium]
MLSVLKILHFYTQGDNQLNILNNCSLNIDAGQIAALVGNSGAGKTTFLQVAGLLEQVQSGDILVEGKSTKAMNDNERTLLRLHTYGFVYQFHHLLPEFNAVENVMLPQLIAKKSEKEARARAEDLLVTLGLEHRLKHRPKQLSGGEQQRVAIARALANKPKILLADEPTGNLDPSTSAEVFEMLMVMVKAEKIAAIIATHNHALARSMDRFVELKNGALIEKK